MTEFKTGDIVRLTKGKPDRPGHEIWVREVASGDAPGMIEPPILRVYEDEGWKIELIEHTDSSLPTKWGQKKQRWVENTHQLERVIAKRNVVIADLEATVNRLSEQLDELSSAGAYSQEALCRAWRESGDIGAMLPGDVYVTRTPANDYEVTTCRTAGQTNHRERIIWRAPRSDVEKRAHEVLEKLKEMLGSDAVSDGEVARWLAKAIGDES